MPKERTLKVEGQLRIVERVTIELLDPAAPA
jgi:hypothetical protein